MKVSLRFALAATTALIAFVQPASADPVSVALAVGATVAGGAATAAIAGTAIVWSAVLGQAAVAGVLAGVSSLLAPKQQAGKQVQAQEITLNRITPVTYGLTIYGRRMVGGSIVARSTTPSRGGKANAVYHSVMPLACHEIDGVEEIYIGDQLVWTEAQYDADEAAGAPLQRRWGQIDGPYKDKMTLMVYKGTDTQEAVPIYVDEAREWKSTARGKGIAYIYCRAPFDVDVFPRGMLPIRALVRGKKVYDPRTDTTAFSANPALHVRDYVLTPEAMGGIGWTEEDVDDAAITALANVADESISLAGGGSEARYEFNGVVDTEAAPEENLNRLSTSWGGWWTCDKGMLTVGGGSYEAPMSTIDEGDMVAPIRVRARRPFEDQFNVVKAVYADPDAEYVPTDLPVLESNTYRLADNGEELVRDLGELPGETGFARGQRLMKLILLKGRRQKSVDVACNLSKIGIGLGDNVRLTVPRRGWDEKTFEVTGKTISIAPGNVSVAFSLIESGPEVFDWNTSEELSKPAGGVPTLASPTDRPIVTAPAVSESLYQTRGGGGFKVRVRLESETDSPFLETYQFSWRRIDVPGDEVILPTTRDNFLLIDDFAPGSYVFGVRGATYQGATAPWAYTNLRTILGANDTPVALTGFAVQAAGGAVALLRWDRHPSLDVQQGGRIEFRHAPALTGATWQSSTGIGKAASGGQTDAALPLKHGTYLARPFDAQNIPGPVVMAATKAPSLAVLSVAGSVTEHPTFSGAKTACTVTAGALVLDDGEAVAEYNFAGEIDLGTVQVVRLVTDLSVAIGRRDALFWDRGGTQFWQRSGDVFWESSAAFGDVDIQVSETDDDPSGSPSWSDYRSFDASEFEARAFRFRAVLTVENNDFEVRISSLKVEALQEA